MEKNILVSVIVPVYNVEKFLPQCIDSLLAQTHPDLEIILVDDGSKDSSGSICDAYAQQDSRVTVLHQENRGQAAARNLGIREAKGEYIGFVDSDDFVESNMYESMLRAALQHDAQIVSCGMYAVDIQGNVLFESHVLPKERVYSADAAAEQLLTFGTLNVSCCDKLFRRNLFDDVKYPEGQTNEDAAIIFDLMLQAEKVVHIGLPMYSYRQWSGSTSKKKYHHGRMVMMDNADRFEAILVPKYPHLRTACRQYHAFVALDVLCLMLKDKATIQIYAEDYRRYIKVLRQNVLFMYNNNNLSMGWKLRGTAIVLGVYGPLYWALKK